MEENIYLDLLEKRAGAKSHDAGQSLRILARSGKYT